MRKKITLVLMLLLLLIPTVVVKADSYTQSTPWGGQGWFRASISGSWVGGYTHTTQTNANTKNGTTMTKATVWDIDYVRSAQAMNTVSVSRYTSRSRGDYSGYEHGHSGLANIVN